MQRWFLSRKDIDNFFMCIFRRSILHFLQDKRYKRIIGTFLISKFCIIFFINCTTKKQEAELGMLNCRLMNRFGALFWSAILSKIIRMHTFVWLYQMTMMMNLVQNLTGKERNKTLWISRSVVFLITDKLRKAFTKKSQVKWKTLH